MSKVDRVRGRLREAEKKLGTYHDALKRITRLGMEETAGAARMIALRVIGLRYASSVEVTTPGAPTVTIDADGEVHALCPECRKTHSLTPPPPSPAPG